MEMRMFSKKNWEDFSGWIQTTDPSIGNVKVPSMEDPRILEGLAILDGDKISIIADKDGVILFVGEKSFPNRNNAAAFVKEMPTFITNKFLTENNFFLGEVVAKDDNAATFQEDKKSRKRKAKKEITPEPIDLFHISLEKKLIQCQVNKIFYSLTPEMLDAMSEKIETIRDLIERKNQYFSDIQEVKVHAESIVSSCDEFLEYEVEMDDIFEDMKSDADELQETLAGIDIP